jgi:hypothetical protein
VDRLPGSSRRKDVTGVVRDAGIAVAAGIIAAVLSYFFGRIVLRPRLRYSEKLRLRIYGAECVAQLKLFNASPFRSVTNIEIAAVVLIPFSDCTASGGNKVNYLRVPLSLSVSQALRLGPRQIRIVSLMASSVPPEFTRKRLEDLKLDHPEPSIVDYMSVDRVKSEDVTPKSRPRPKLLITVNCKDSITGRDFSFLLAPFYRSDLCSGIFSGSDDTGYDRIARGVARGITKAHRFWQRRRETGFEPDEGQQHADNELLKSVADAYERAQAVNESPEEEVMGKCNVDPDNARKLIRAARKSGNI